MGHENYYAWLNSEYREKRDFLVKALQGAGFETPDYSRTAGGGFFIMAGITPEVESRVPQGRVGEVNESAPTGKVRLDWAMCEHMVREEGVGAWGVEVGEVVEDNNNTSNTSPGVLVRGQAQPSRGNTDS